MCILLSGCKLSPSKPIFQPAECVPDIQVVEKLVRIDPELTQQHRNPKVPTHGDNSVLLEWVLACASNVRALNLQMDAIRKSH